MITGTAGVKKHQYSRLIFELDKAILDYKQCSLGMIFQVARGQIDKSR